MLHDSLTTPVPFASLGVRNKPLGTVTNEFGRFQFPDSPTLSGQDTVVVSCVGYWPVRLPVQQLRQHPAVVRLRPRAQALREVTVQHRQLRPEVLGHSGKSGLARWGIGGMAQDSSRQHDMRGREFGTFLKPARNCYVDSFNVYIESNPFTALRLRLMLYTVRNGKPAEPLLTDDVQFVVRDQRTGWVSVDLRSYNLRLEKKQPVAVAMQWLDSEGAFQNNWFFGIPAVFPAPLHQVFGRDKSQARWKTFPMQPSLYLAVQSWQE
ncbi:hypothetical protein HNQ93_002328 [Hymenobacter luteus]|uniref:Carboxypeptidase-like regulatory domain-containing protein n=2 Tax=Hymenobacter TaxID=89966 RepID=A0A7W9WBX7_9BACT|nr:carboxypeptidase-like regulatory domain-containing protein [Hymenobacter latericoloratus]MBB4602103.1 hypothetical protein [Hymenobacter latericoloratus]MBB6059468.1 hypothetical protein [Hymenobacter luteus]